MEWLIIIGLAAVAFISLVFAIDDTNVLTIIFSILFCSIFFFWIYQIVKKPKIASRQGEELIRRFQEIGVQAAWLKKRSNARNVGLMKRILGIRCEGVIEIIGRSVDYVCIMSKITSWWGIVFYNDYLVKAKNQSPAKWAFYTSYVFLDNKRGYIRIRNAAIPLSKGQFEEIDSLARQIKSE